VRRRVQKTIRPGGLSVSASIGIYDGIHAGHRAVLKELLKCPGTKKVFVFFRNPNKAGNIVTSAAERKTVLAGMGLEPVMLKIEKYWKMSARAFLEDVLVKKYNVRRLVIGEDFVFGRKKEGTVASLKKWARELGLEVKVVRTKARGGMKISTTLIKKLIALSKTSRAAALMGRPYRVSGRKVQGLGIARTLGFPTVNLMPEKHKLVPAGVFAAEVTCASGRFRAVVNSGGAPTFGIKKVFEFHALHRRGQSPDPLTRVPRTRLKDGGFSASSVKGTVPLHKCSKFTVEFGRFIRKQKKFASRGALIERIKKDIEIAKKRRIC